MKGRKPSEKRIRAAFVELRDLVRAKCLELGGVPGDEAHSSVNLWIPTTHGALLVRGPHDESEWMDVFAVFDDSRRAARGIGDVNQFSGKWNLHSGSIREGVTPRDCFEHWCQLLKPLEGGDIADVHAAIAAREERRKRWAEEAAPQGETP